MSIQPYVYPSAVRTNPNAPIIELVFAGNALANFLYAPGDDGQRECICGKTGTPELLQRPIMHALSCPVARFYAAVEAVRKAAL